MKEFETIAAYFRPLTESRAEALSLLDDAAVFCIPKDHELVVTTDMLVAGVHFAADFQPQHIAHKSLRVNLSDLAAMGARPLSYQLAISYPEKPSHEWLAAFTSALAEDQKTFGIFCSGGDTTRTSGPLTISITAMGLVPHGKAVKRSGGKAGDILVLTGPVGDACLGLNGHKGAHFESALHKPLPRLDVAECLRTHAHAAIDVSDGLIADTAHLARASGCAAEIRVTPAFFSAPALALIQSGAVRDEDLLTGGDDYQIVVAAEESALAFFPGAIVIGRLTTGTPGQMTVYGLKGEILNPPSYGWTHF